MSAGYFCDIRQGIPSLLIMLAVRAVLHRSAALARARTPTSITPRHLSTRSDNMDHSAKTVMRYKRVFGVALFGTTVLGALWLRKRRSERVKVLLEDCVRVSLPPGHYEPNVSFYRYKGFVLPGQIVLSGVLQKLPHFQFRETDVLVASFPKTGTTWVQEIVYMLKHNCRPSSDTDPTLETRFPYLEYPYPGLKSVEAMPGQRCIKTHLPLSLLPPSLHTAGTKVVYVTRNPRDTAVSYYHFVRLLTTAGFIGTFDDFIDDFLDNKVPYSSFYDHVRSYQSAVSSTPSLLVLSYEQMTCDPATAVRSIAQHLNVAVSEEDVQFVVAHTSFHAMARNNSVNYEHWKDVGFARSDRGNFLRKGKVGDWQNSLNEDHVQRFKEWEQHNRLPSDYNFAFTFTEACKQFQ